MNVHFLFYSIGSIFTNFEFMNESSYYKFFDSIFTYKKEFTLKYTMIDTQKESIYSRLHFFNVISGEQWMEANNFIFSTIITYGRRVIHWNDIRNAEFRKKYNLIQRFENIISIIIHISILLISFSDICSWRIFFSRMERPSTYFARQYDARV